MPRDAPRPKQDAIRSGRELAARERATVWPYLIREIAVGGIFYGPLVLLAYRSWKRGDSWLGIAIFSVGSLAVVAWFALRQVRAGKQRRALRDRLEASRRRRREPRTSHPVALD